MGQHTHAVARLVQGLAIGAAAMYLLDPDKGRRRRAMARDKLQRFANDSLKLAHQATRDARHRLQGVNARIGQCVSPEGGVDELRLIERARSALGRCVTHPHAIQVGARGSTIVLSGPVLRHEIGELLSVVRGVPGVGAVENHLDAHDTDDGVPSLQGTGRARGNGGPRTWTPALRLTALVGGGVLTLYGLGKRSATGLLLASAGAGLANRVIGNEPGQRAAPRDGGARMSASGRDAERRGAASVARVGDEGAPATPQQGVEPPGRMSRDAAGTDEVPPLPGGDGQGRGSDRPPF